MLLNAAAESPLSELPSWPGRILWLLVAPISFHLAYLFPPCAFLIGIYCFALWKLSWQRTRFQAMNTGWVLAFLIYAPHLAFFWRIFGPAAIGLWLLLGFWLGLFLALVRFAREKWGIVAAVCLAPLLWTGFEYFRSELYYLRFSWLNVGCAFSWSNGLPHTAWLGVYGIGFVLMAAASAISLLSARRSLFAALAGLGLLVLVTNLPRAKSESPAGREFRVAGIQLEFPAELEVPSFLDRLIEKYPDADLYVLSEYTFQGPDSKAS